MKTSISTSIIISLLLTATGCGSNVVQQSIEENVVENVVENIAESNLEGEGTVDIDITDNTMRYEGEEGEVVVYGGGGAVPEDFPTDVPLYPEATIVAAAVAPEGSSLSMTTTDSTADVTTWYASELSEWAQTANMDFGFSSTQVYEKDGITISISISTVEELTSITVIRAEE